MNKIEEFIRDQDFYKIDTPTILRVVYDRLIAVGTGTTVAFESIQAIVHAIKSEYGE